MNITITANTLYNRDGDKTNSDKKKNGNNSVGTSKIEQDNGSKLKTDSEITKGISYLGNYPIVIHGGGGWSTTNYVDKYTHETKYSMSKELNTRGGSIDIYRGCPLEDGEIPVVFRFSNGRVEIPNKDYVAWDLDDKFNTCACLTSLFTCSLLNYNSSIIPSSEDTIEAGRLIPLSECTKYGDPLYKSDRIYFLTVKNGEVQSISHFLGLTIILC